MANFALLAVAIVDLILTYYIGIVLAPDSRPTGTKKIDTSRPVVAYSIYEADTPRVKPYPNYQSVLSFKVANFTASPQDNACWYFAAASPGIVPLAAEIHPDGGADKVLFERPPGHKLLSSVNMKEVPQGESLLVRAEGNRLVLGISRLQLGREISGKLWFEGLLRGQADIAEASGMSDTTAGWPQQYDERIQGDRSVSEPTVAMDRVAWAAIVSVLSLLLAGPFVFLAGRK